MMNEPSPRGESEFSAAQCSASRRTNPHIIVGQGLRCVCGMYKGSPLTCGDVLASLDDLVKHANIQGSGVSHYASDILKLEAVIRPLVQECE